jgi:hypothetical protein
VATASRLYFPGPVAHFQHTMKRFGLSDIAVIGLAFLLAPTLARTQTNDLPHFQEVLRLLRANLPDVTDDDLNRAAVQGLLDHFRPRVLVVTNEPVVTPTTAPAVSHSVVYEHAFGYLRLQRVTAGVADEFGSALDRLRSAQALKGLVLDLRFANGDDYRAAATLADRFLTKEQPLLEWGESSARSTAKSGVTNLPLAVLVNRETSGSAEALAELLRVTRVALLVGSPTAGQAYTFREFTLANGPRLRIAGAPVRVGEDLLLTNRVAPDIAVDVPAEQERVHFADPFKVLTAAPTITGASAFAAAARTNRALRPRLNEAELVRRQREQAPEDLPLPASRPQDSDREEKVLQDAALVRALDLLKGIALVSRAGRS